MSEPESLRRALREVIVNLVGQGPGGTRDPDAALRIATNALMEPQSPAHEGDTP